MFWLSLKFRALLVLKFVVLFMDERLPSYVKVVSALEGEDVSEEMRLVETNSDDNNDEYHVIGEDFVDAVSLESDFAVLDYNFPDFANLVAEIVSTVEDLAGRGASYTHGSLDDEVFDIDNDITPFRSHEESSYRADADFEGASIILEYGERTSYGIGGGSETARLTLSVEGDIEFEYNNSWDKQ